MRRITAFCFIFFLVFSLRAFSAETVLVISKDEPGYQAVAAGFRSAFPGEFEEINLEGSDEKVRQVGKDWEASPPDLAVVVGDMAAQLAKWYLKDVPIIYCDAGYAAKISLTEKKAVGIYHEPDPFEQMRMMHDIFPDKTRVGILYSPEYARIDESEIKKEAEALGLSIELAAMANVKEVPGKLRKIMTGKDLLWIFTDPVVLNDISIQYIVVQAITSRIPIFCGDKTLAKLGATAALAPDLEDAGIKAAQAAEEVLGGSEPAPGTTRYPKGKLILSRKMASLMNVSFPESLADTAAEVVQ